MYQLDDQILEKFLSLSQSYQTPQIPFECCSSSKRYRISQASTEENQSVLFSCGVTIKIQTLPLELTQKALCDLLLQSNGNITLCCEFSCDLLQKTKQSHGCCVPVAAV
jgi:hypothetical protein